MKPKKINNSQGELFRSRLSSTINPKHALKMLADQMNWQYFEEAFGKYYKETGAGQPPKPIRLMVSLLMLGHMFNKSDEQLVAIWLENPYWQYFSGYDFLQIKDPIHPSSLTRFRQRLGKEGVTKILQWTINEGIEKEVIQSKDLKRVIADTTAMEKNITYPTDTKNLNKSRQKLVKLAKKHKIFLRQNYKRIGAKEAWKAARYAHAKQFKRMRASIKKLKTYLGRVYRDITRQIKDKNQLQAIFADDLSTALKLLTQTKKSKNKIYSTHEKDVYCLAKGKARKPYEYGCKVSLVTTQKKGFVLEASALKENTHDSKTLQKSLQNAEKNTGYEIKEVLADKGYRGHGIKDKKILIPNYKKHMSRYEKQKLKKRSAIEAYISHMKNQGKLDRNYLKGLQGDELNALLCAIGHNMRRLLYNYIIILILAGVFCGLPVLENLFCTQQRKKN